MPGYMGIYIVLPEVGKGEAKERIQPYPALAPSPHFPVMSLSIEDAVDPFLWIQFHDPRFNHVCISTGAASEVRVCSDDQTFANCCCIGNHSLCGLRHAHTVHCTSSLWN